MTCFFEKERARRLAIAKELRAVAISMGDLSFALRLAPTSAMRLGIPVHTAGKKGDETLFTRDGVAAYLTELNDGAVTWPEDDLLLTPREACVVLRSHGQVVSPALLAKWRQRQCGPSWIRVTRRAIRYWQCGLIDWLYSR